MVTSMWIGFVLMMPAYAVDPQSVSGKRQIPAITKEIFVKRGKHDER